MFFALAVRMPETPAHENEKNRSPPRVRRGVTSEDARARSATRSRAGTPRRTRAPS